MSLPLTADYVYRDYEIDGIAASGDHEPDKREIRELLSSTSIIPDGTILRSKLIAALSASIPINVKEYGAVGNGSINDAAAINTALAGGNKHVYFPAGVYRVNSYLRVYENTKIELHPNAVIMHANTATDNLFLNGQSGDNTYATSYNGEGNLWFTGGTLDMSIKTAALQTCEGIGIAHAKTVLIENMRFINNYQDHFIEINSSKDVLIRNCVFKGTTLNAPSSRECINIDFAFETGFPHLGAYDNTVCDGVTIEDCYFANGDVAVGSHSDPLPGTYHKNIRFIRNNVEDMASAGVAPQFWDSGEVTGNTFTRTGNRGVKAWGTKNFKIRDNIINGQCSDQGITVDDNSGFLPIDIEITGNILKNVTGVGINIGDAQRVMVQGNQIVGSGLSAINETNSTDCKFIENNIRGANQLGGASDGITIDGVRHQLRGNIINNGGYATQYAYGINLQASSSDIVVESRDVASGSVDILRLAGTRMMVNGAYRVSLADDTAAILPASVFNAQGMMLISAESDNSPSPRAVVWVRAAVTAVCSLISGVTDANVTYTTGILTGTTGTDGKVTVSAHTNGNVYVENRSGGTKAFVISFVGGF